MMKNIFVWIFAVSAGLFVFGSCAQEKSPDLGGLQDNSLAAWIDIYDPSAALYPNGMYGKKLAETTKPNAVNPQLGQWVKIDYTLRMLDGTIVATRDSIAAHNAGSFTRFTHYSPENTYFSVGGGYYIELSVGMIEAIYEMKEGEQWRFYLPSRLAYGVYEKKFGNGYDGESPIPENSPLIMDVRLNAVMPNPKSYERDEVIAYAMNKLGKSPTDTLMNGYYINVSESLGDTLSVRVGKEVDVYYVERSLDGFVLDTNIPDTAIKYNIYYDPDGIKYGSLHLDMSKWLESGDRHDADTVYVKGLFYALESMKYGQTATAVFISDYGYSYYGARYNESNHSVVQPYEPLVYDIITIAKGGEGSEDLPYFVHGVINFSGNATNTWVTGIVVGVVEGGDIDSDANITGPFTSKTNLLIADRTDNLTVNRTVAVELIAGSDIEKALNLVDNPSILGKRIKFNADIGTCLGRSGVMNVRSYSIVTE